MPLARSVTLAAALSPGMAPVNAVHLPLRPLSAAHESPSISRRISKTIFSSTMKATSNIERPSLQGSYASSLVPSIDILRTSPQGRDLNFIFEDRPGRQPISVSLVLRGHKCRCERRRTVPVCAVLKCAKRGRFAYSTTANPLFSTVGINFSGVIGKSRTRIPVAL